MISTKEISRILYTHDPMDTSCNVNENMENEYDHEAVHMVVMMREGHAFEAALHFVFAYTFSKGCLRDNPATPLIISDYYKYKRANPQTEF